MSRDPAVLAWALATNQRDLLIGRPVAAPLTAAEERVLADLEVSLRECRALGVPWRVDAAFIAATATVLDALGEVS